MQGLRPLALGGCVVATVELTTGTVAFAALGPATIALFLLVCAMATAATTAGLAALIVRRRGRGYPPGDSDGWRPRRGPDPPPPWWPDFEREFWAHVERRPQTFV